MAGKKEAKQKAGPRGQTEKNREETESSTGTKNTSKEGGQSIAQKKQPRAEKEQRPEEGAQGQRRVDGKDLQEGWETIKEIDRMLGHLEGRLDKVTAVIRQVAVQGKALELVMPEEEADGAGSEESSGELEVPALQSSMEEHRIVDIQEPASGAPKPGGSQEETEPSPSSANKGDRREERSVWPSLEEQRRRAEEEYGKLGGLSHGCRQSWDLRMQEEKGPGRKINGLFHWISDDSLILHEVARAAGLEGRGPVRRVNPLCMKDVESTCAYWVPLVDWKGEVKYLAARGVDNIAQLPGNEDPRKWYDRFPSLAEARDAEMMIAKDNWKWMPVRQASRLTERQDNAKIRDKRLLARTQFGKRLLLLPCVEASEVVPPEEDDEDRYTERGVSRDPMATTRMLDQEETEDAQWIERRAQDFCGHAEVHRRRAENKRRSGAWRSRPRELVSRKLTRARATLVGVIAMLIASLAGLAGVEGFQAYDCSNSSNPVDMYSLLDPEPCPTWQWSTW